MPRRTPTVVAVVALLLAVVAPGCAAPGATPDRAATPQDGPPMPPVPPGPPAPPAPPEATPTTTPAGDAPGVPTATCRARGAGTAVLPDPRCTPGTLDPAVDQADIAVTICRRGWTATRRPPLAVTEAAKRSGMVAYGDTGPLSAYEEDHLVPLELGGAASDPANLWPEPGAAPNAKDAVEAAARRAVCDGSLTLDDARRAIRTDWVALGAALGVTP